MIKDSSYNVAGAQEEGLREEMKYCLRWEMVRIILEDTVTCAYARLAEAEGGEHMNELGVFFPAISSH